MPKILTDKELAEIVHDAVYKDLIDCGDSYLHFLEDLGKLVADHFGGEATKADYLDDDLGYTVAFHVDDCVPPDGGVFKKYDTDVKWEDGEEYQP
jgi:hypothetical protein